MTEFADRIWEERRLLMLQLLNGMDDGSAGDRSLTLGLRDLGHDRITRDQVQTHLSWMKDQRLISIIPLADGAMAVTITQRGADIAAGRSAIPGVLRGGRV
jgi:hypothetical protein